MSEELLTFYKQVLELKLMMDQEAAGHFNPKELESQMNTKIAATSSPELQEGADASKSRAKNIKKRQQKKKKKINAANNKVSEL